MEDIKKLKIFTCSSCGIHPQRLYKYKSNDPGLCADCYIMFYCVPSPIIETNK